MAGRDDVAIPSHLIADHPQARRNRFGSPPASLAMTARFEASVGHALRACMPASESCLRQDERGGTGGRQRRFVKDRRGTPRGTSTPAPH
jgi:hypothetical protein